MYQLTLKFSDLVTSEGIWISEKHDNLVSFEKYLVPMSSSENAIYFTVFSSFYVHVLCFKPSWIYSMTDWLTDRQTYTSWLIDWFIHCITFHRPVINSSFCDKSKGVDINPFPEGDILHHGMCLHFAFHFNVKDLKSSSSWKWKVEQSTLDGMQKNVLIMQKFQQ